MKTYITLLSVVLGLAIVVTGSYFYMKDKPMQKEALVSSDVSVLEGAVTRIFEGENKITYALDIPTTATSTLGMEGALIKVTEGGAPYVSIYFSYEGGRGYMPEDYIRGVIMPRVRSVLITGTTSIGAYTWTHAETEASEWHVAQVGDGQWLMIVESKRFLHDRVAETLASVSTD
jgi:hypothetical protein